MFVTETARTTASPEKIWKIWTDVTNWKKWDPLLKEARIKGGFRERARGTMVAITGLKTVFRVTRCIPNFTYTLSMRLFFASIHIHRYLGYNNQKTTFTHEIWIEGPLVDVWWSILGKRIERILHDEMKGVKKIAEAIISEKRAEVPAMAV